MAPELFEIGKPVITEKIDVWAFGCTLIEIFANVKPYEGKG